MAAAPPPMGGGGVEGEGGEEEWRMRMGELKEALAACDDGTKVWWCVGLNGWVGGMDD